MKGLIDTLLAAPAETRLFLREGAWISAGQVRAAAARAMQGIGPGDVTLHTASAARFVSGLLAAAALGRRIILPAHTQASYLADIGASSAILDDAAIGDADASDAEANIFADVARDPTLVFFTSGSTGAPKPVEKKLSRLEIEARVQDALWGGDAGFVHATVSHQHIYGLLFRVAWPILSGRTASDEAATYWEELEGKLSAATTLISSPAHLTRLPPNLAFPDPPKLVFSSGQLLPADAAIDCARAFGRPPIEVFGSTETGGIAWRRQTELDAPWTPFEVVRVSADAEGALEVRSPYLADERPHLTGDGLDLLEDGQFRLLPRRDRVAKIDGKRVSLARVEEKLAALPEVESALALALPKRRGALAAIVVPSAAGRMLLASQGAFRFSRELRKACASALEPAERPKHWRFVADIPVNAQGKRVLTLMQALFDQDDPLAPLTLEVRRHTDTEAELAFRLAPDLVFFRGHFAEHPILPGVAQAHLAVLFAERLWGFRPESADLSRVKFRRVLRPNEDVVVKLSRDSTRVRFSFHLGDIDISQGEIGRA